MENTLTSEALYDLYIEDLQKTETYKDGTVHPRVKNINAWKRLKTSCKNPDGPLDLTAEINNGRNVFFISDHHLGHNNVLKYCNRPFPTTELMRDCLIGNHNKLVSTDDIVVFVGDVAFLDSHAKVNEILNQMNGYKILVLGNHDIERDRYEHYVFDEICVSKAFQHTFNERLINFVLTHYPFTNVPEDMYFNTLNIHGHIHDKLSKEEHQINVSVEAVNYKPIHFNDILIKAERRLAAMAGVCA
jgi:calcineurin-like phosphoesterase family protein